MTVNDLTNISDAVLAALGLEPDWTVRTEDGAGFVAAELGVWLHAFEAEDLPWLRAEVRVALDVPDGPTTHRFLDARNHRALVGRWAHDPATGVVVLAADLPASAPLLPYAVEGVAEMVCAAETVAFLSAPQRDLGGAKALTLIDGLRRRKHHPVAEHLPETVYRAGESPEVAGSVLCLVQDTLLHAIPEGWGFEHHDGETLAADVYGSALLLRVSRHPVAGWGLMVAMGGDRYACDEADAVAYAAALNRRDTAPGGTGLPPTPGSWTYNGAGLEHRAFLTAALLSAGGDGGDPFVPVRFVEACVRAAAARADTRLLDRPPPPPPTRPIAVHAAWPGDDEAAITARRDPYNDGLDDQDGYVYLDALGRACAITERSFALWRSRLHPQDEPEVAGFVRWAESEIAHRARRSGVLDDGPSD